MKCAEIREILPAQVRDGEDSLAVRRHLARCPECKAELARYDDLLEGLGALAARAVEPPAGLLDALVAIPLQETRLASVKGHVVRHRNRYLGGAAVAAVGVAGAVLWHTRSRRLAAA